MYYHQGIDFQRGRGFGSLFTGLFRRFIPIAKNLTSRVLSSDLVKHVSSKALNAGEDMVRNIASDVLSGNKKFSESFGDELNNAKKKVGEAIRGRGRGRKRKRICNSKNHKRMLQSFNLLE